MAIAEGAVWNGLGHDLEDVGKDQFYDWKRQGYQAQGTIWIAGSTVLWHCADRVAYRANNRRDVFLIDDDR